MLEKNKTIDKDLLPGSVYGSVTSNQQGYAIKENEQKSLFCDNSRLHMAKVTLEDLAFVPIADTDFTGIEKF